MHPEQEAVPDFCSVGSGQSRRTVMTSSMGRPGGRAGRDRRCAHIRLQAGGGFSAVVAGRATAVPAEHHLFWIL